MENEQSIEYCHLRDETLAKMRLHSYIDGGQHVFQYLVLPSFSPPVSFDVFSRRRSGYDDDFVITKTTWRSDIDGEKLRTPVERLRHPRPLEPTIELDLLSVPSARLSELSTELAKLQLPIGPNPNHFGIDGTTYEVAVDQPSINGLSAKCRLSWWHAPPLEWQDLASWIRKVEAIVEMSQHYKKTAPYRILPINDAASRQDAQRLFHQGKYAEAAELLADIKQRESLSESEARMLEICMKKSDGK